MSQMLRRQLQRALNERAGAVEDDRTPCEPSTATYVSGDLLHLTTHAFALDEAALRASYEKSMQRVLATLGTLKAL
jgi:hypothetical protein